LKIIVGVGMGTVLDERVVNRWNGLKQETIETTNINTFKRYFDKERKTWMDLFMD